MSFINGISEVSNPVLLVAPVILMTMSGFVIGRVITYFYSLSPSFIRDISYGNIVLNFIFVAGFILTGTLDHGVVEFFTFFTVAIVILTVVASYLLLKDGIAYLRNTHLLLGRRVQINSDKTIYIGGVILFISLIVFYAFIIYYHSIFSEYDSVYLFLLASKSILLGNGIDEDFYTGSDMIMRFPPFGQAVNAWLIHSFGYSAFRFFPLYFVFFASVYVFNLARNVTRDSFLGLVASIAFLIAPAMLATSSLYSLQQDLLFICFLTSGMYFFTEIIRKEKEKENLKIDILLMTITLALLTLSRELGLVIAIALIFMVPALKFTKERIKLRILLSLLALLPFYILATYNLIRVGFTGTSTIELLSLVIVNCAIIYVLYHTKDHYDFKWFVKKHYKYLFIFSIPLIFIGSNLLTFQGPYPVFTFSPQLNAIFSEYRQLMGFDDHLQSSFSEAFWRWMPRLDLLFVSVALGGIFIFIKLRGFGRLIYNIKNDTQYQLVIILLSLLLLNWSFLLSSGFEGALVRHIAYFVPMISVILVLGLWRKEKYFKLIYLALLTFALYYFISINIYVTTYDNKFGGFRLDPEKSALITFLDLRIAGLIFALLLILETFGNKLGQKIISLRKIQWSTFQGILTLAIVGVVLSFQIYFLLANDIDIISHEQLDQVPPADWEQNVFEVINYLNQAEEGNVLSIRIPAIPFFTNRTTFDIYNPHTFVSTIHPLLRAENSSELNKMLLSLQIRYVIVPKSNENQLSYIAENLRNNSKLLHLIESDQNFEKIPLQYFNIYKYTNGTSVGSSTLNLLDQKFEWRPVINTLITHNRTLTVLVESGSFDTLYNRAVLKIPIDADNKPFLLSLQYESESFEGEGSFRAEIRDRNDQILWGSKLRQTDGRQVEESFVLPGEEIVGKNVELRFYVITHSPGIHSLEFNKATIIYD